MDGRRKPGRQETRQRGFTLLEILLVLAIVIAVAAMAIPVLNGTFAAQRLHRAGDVVRADWSRARIQAIRNGEEWAFSYQPGSGQYMIAPYSPYTAPTLPQTTATLDASDQRSNFSYGNGMLPSGIVFSSANVTEDTRSQALTSEGQGASNLITILFYPDGTTQQAQVTLINDRNWYVQINLRGLTGTATVTDVAALNATGTP